MGRPKEIVIPASEKHSHRGLAAKIRRQKMKHPELSNTAIARKLQCSPQNVDQVIGRFLGKNTPEHLESFQQHKPSILEAVQFRFLESISDKKLAKTSASQAIVAAGILQDKIQLMRGQPTGINVTALIDVAAAIRSKREGLG